MSCKTETKQIGDREFSVTQWSAEKSLLTKLKLVKIFGASLTAMVSSMDSENDEPKAISDGLNLMFQNNEPEEILSIVKNCIVDNVACGDTRITGSSFNELFSGDNLMDVYKVFFFVLKVNYGNLFKGQLADKLLASVKDKL